MAVNTYTVFEFNQTTDITLLQSRLERQRNALLRCRKKTILTDALIRKYHEKNDLLLQTQNDYTASIEKCKQVCIEYNSSLDKCLKLETETKTLQTTNRELENNLGLAKIQEEGIKSHANQLQIEPMLESQSWMQIEYVESASEVEEMLIEEYKTSIEALKIENQLEKFDAQSRDKKIAGLTKDNKELTKNIHAILNVALKNKNLKGNHKTLLNKYKKLYKYDESSQEADNSKNEADTFENYECNKNTNCSIDANAHIQTDDGLPCIGALNNEDNKTFANKATSPIKQKTSDAALSPIKKLQTPDVCDKQTTCVKRNEMATSPITFCNKSVSYENNQDIESNNRCFLSDDDKSNDSNDCEIETILCSMRINHNVVTPIPSTPLMSPSRRTSISEHSEHGCLEAAKVHEENKTLLITVEHLTKEVMSIKRMLKFHSMTEESDNFQANDFTRNDPCTQKNHGHERAVFSIANENSVFNPHSDTENQCLRASLDTVVNDFSAAEDEANEINSTNFMTESDKNSTPKMCAVVETRKKRKSVKRLYFSEGETQNKVNQKYRNSIPKNVSIQEKRKSLKRTSLDEPEMQNQIFLRRTSVHSTISNNSQSSFKDTKQYDKTICKEGQVKISHELDASSRITNYSDLGICTHKPTVQSSDETQHAQEIQSKKLKRKIRKKVVCERC